MFAQTREPWHSNAAFSSEEGAEVMLKCLCGMRDDEILCSDVYSSEAHVSGRGRPYALCFKYSISS